MMVATALALVFTPGLALAAFTNPLSDTVVLQALEGFVKAVIYVGTPGVIILLMWAGFSFVSAQGNPDGIARAKRTFIWGCIAALLLFGLWAITTLVGNTLASLPALGLLVIIAVAFVYIVFGKS